MWDFRFSGAVVVEPAEVARLRAFEVAVRDRMAGSRTVFVTDHRPLLTYAAQFYGRLVRPLGRSVVTCRTGEEAAQYLVGESVPLLHADRAA